METQTKDQFEKVQPLTYPFILKALTITKTGDFFNTEETVYNETQESAFRAKYQEDKIEIRPFLQERWVENLPATQSVTNKKESADTRSKSWYEKAFSVYIVWPLLVLIIGSLILKYCNVI